MNNGLPAQDAAPEGWVLRAWPGTFSAHAGPFYFREQGETPGVGFFAEQRHRNLGDVVHGGMLMTLADMSIFDICFRAAGQFRAVTVSLNAEFIAPAPLGAFVTATGEMTGGGKSLMFARGIVEAEGARLMSFSGAIKRLKS